MPEGVLDPDVTAELKDMMRRMRSMSDDEIISLYLFSDMLPNEDCELLQLELVRRDLTKKLQFG